MINSLYNKHLIIKEINNENAGDIKDICEMINDNNLLIENLRPMKTFDDLYIDHQISSSYIYQRHKHNIKLSAYRISFSIIKINHTDSYKVSETYSLCYCNSSLNSKRNIITNKENIDNINFFYKEDFDLNKKIKYFMKLKNDIYSLRKENIELKELLYKGNY